MSLPSWPIPDPPVPPELKAVVRDIVILERFEGHDRDLVRGLGLMLPQALGQALLDRRAQDPGLVHHTAGELRELGRRPRAAREQQAKDHPQGAEWNDAHGG